MRGFCDRCHRMLSNRTASAHDTPEECIEVLLTNLRFVEEWRDREHRWVHRLEDEIAQLRNELKHGT